MSQRLARGASKAATATALATLLVAAGANAAWSATRSSGPSLTIALQGTIESFDPWSTPNGFNGSLLSNVAAYDSLVHLDAKGDPTPWLATKWTSTDASHYTLTLRKDVKFTDGTPLNAAAVVKNFEYAGTVQSPNECSKYLAGAIATAPNATTVQVALKAPNTGFITDLGTCAGFVVNPKALANPAGLKTTPAGSGPYVTDAANSVAGRTWAFKRNTKYWNKKAYPFDTVKLAFFADATAAANAARAGQVDLIQSVDATHDTSGLKIALTSTDFRGLFIGDAKGAISAPLGNVKVRQAMQYAIDRQAIASSLFGDKNLVSYSSPFTSDAVGYTAALANRFPYDPAKAKALLAEAGYPDGFSVKVMSVPFIYGDGAQAIAGQLAKVGIKLELEDHVDDFFPQLTSGKWAMMTFNYSILTNRIHSYQGLVDPDGFWNQLHSVSPTITALFDELNAAKGTAAQTAVMKKMAVAFQEESWFLVPSFVRGATVYNSGKLAVTTTAGSPVVFLYNVKTA